MTDHLGRIACQPSASAAPASSRTADCQRQRRSAASPATATIPALAETSKAPYAHILVLDDEQTIAELLGEMLGLLGYATRFATPRRMRCNYWRSAIST